MVLINNQIAMPLVCCQCSLIHGRAISWELCKDSVSYQCLHIFREPTDLSTTVVILVYFEYLKPLRQNVRRVFKNMVPCQLPLAAVLQHSL
jgi:hypothetical protein